MTHMQVNAAILRATAPGGAAISYDLGTIHWDTSGHGLGSQYLVKVTALADPDVTDSSRKKGCPPILRPRNDQPWPF